MVGGKDGRGWEFSKFGGRHGTPNQTCRAEATNNPVIFNSSWVVFVLIRFFKSLPLLSWSQREFV